eukprot:CAMPEP_0182416492 /NCGR_PEP_ID=MMETSP1167-20130531/799_1 /TAXON_ID=2988 /ORGANISM="Mallomonas Sp, Strain CCMP3275" /LENGTH=684 /DNA_ID=CAMNT_0024589295 /DNA_START=135 /DNA_END=2189 /DNA_ORIENTATION=-
MEDSEQAILDWVNTFALPNGCSSLSDLCDGSIIITMLAEISPDHFDASSASMDVSENWALKASQFKRILRMLEDYYTNVVQKSIDMGAIDVNLIAREFDKEQLFNILELVVGCAVLSENKAHFIGNIFSLNHESQTVLKGMVERVMNRTVEIPGGEREREREIDMSDTDAQYVEEEGGSEDLIRAREMIRYLQEEKQQLDSRVSELERSNLSLSTELSHTKELLLRSEQERDVTEGSERERAMVIANTSATLQMDLVECKREVDLKNLEIDSLKTELRSANERLVATREMQARLEVDAQQMADELDLARDKAGQLAKAEATIEKYQRKLEEMTTLKKNNQSLEAKLDTYMDRIAELESSNKNISTLNRMVEQYKDKAVELEREKFEAISEVQMKQDEMRRLSGELEEAVEARNFLQDELSGARAELEHFKEQHGERESEGGLGMFESISSLKEQLKQQELELRVARKAGGGGGSEEITLLQAELEDIRRIKREREEMLISTKRQLAESQQEAQKYAKALNEALEGGAGGGMSVGTAGISKEELREMEQQLSMKSNTIRQMESLIREKESDINRLEQEKGKLESYAKRTLNTFKEKYMTALQSMKTEKKALEDKVSYLQNKAERDQETHRREERLLLSSMYELGVRMMDRNIQLEMRDNSSNPTTFLAAQRAEQDRTSLGGTVKK